MRRIDETLAAERVERVDDALHAGPVEHGDHARLLVGELGVSDTLAL